MGIRQPGFNRVGFRRVATTSATAAGGGGSGAASWSLTSPRFFAVDGTNGNDGNTGFSDVSLAAAGVSAKKTIAGLQAIVPPSGAGRSMIIAITAGTYTDALNALVSGLDGYQTVVIRGTVTNATAASVAFANDSADRTMAGGVTFTGGNAAGYNPTGAPTTSVVQCVLNGGGAPGLSGDPAAPLGWRMRFDAATTTAALRNVCRTVGQVTGGDTITLTSVLPAVPVAADVFYLEQPGVNYPASTIFGTALTGNNGVQLVGLRCTGTLTISGAAIHFVFCGVNAFTASQSSWVFPGRVYADNIGSITTGGGLRVETSAGMFSFSQLLAAVDFVTAGAFNVTDSLSWVWGSGCFCGGLMNLHNIRQEAEDNLGTVFIGVKNTTVGVPRLTTRLVLNSSTATIGNVLIQGAGANPAINVVGTCMLWLGTGAANSAPQGSTGNTDVGVSVQTAAGSTIVVNNQNLPTLTGTAGDMRILMDTPQAISWAVAAQGVGDMGRNAIIGASPGSSSIARCPTAVAMFSGQIAGAAGATVSYLTQNNLGGANQANPFRFPFRRKCVITLTATVLADTSANQVTLTIFKTGVATAVVLNIPAGTAANTKFTNGLVNLFFGDTDDLDLRLDDPAGDAGGVVQVSAVLEFAC